jgi:hypothetical protein
MLSIGKEPHYLQIKSILQHAVICSFFYAWGSIHEILMAGSNKDCETIGIGAPSKSEESSD